MHQILGLQELYTGCLWLGFLYVAGSLMVSGIHTGHAGSRLAGHHSRGAGTIRSTASVRAGTARHASTASHARGKASGSDTVAESRFIGCAKKVRHSESDIVEKIFFLLMGVFNPM